MTNNDQNKPRKGLEPELMKVPTWSLFYSACKQECALISYLPPGSSGHLKKEVLTFDKLHFHSAVLGV